MTTTTDATVEVPAPLNTRLVEARLRMLDLPLPAAGERLPDVSLRVPPGDKMLALVSLLRDDLPALIAAVDEARDHATRYEFDGVAAERTDHGWTVTGPGGCVAVGPCFVHRSRLGDQLPAQAYYSREEAIALARYLAAEIRRVEALAS